MALVSGKNLTQAQRSYALRVYVNRFTGQHRPSWAKDGTAMAPTHRLDTEWLDDHAFYIKADGSFDLRHKTCEPAFLAS